MRQKTEWDAGSRDDTSLNKIQIKWCHKDDWNKQYKSQELGFTEWGKWGKWTMCPQNSYIESMMMKLEGEGGDDTASNGFQISCQSISTKEGYIWERKVVANGGKYGKWRGWTKYQRDWFMCAGDFRAEKSQGKGDDTAFNGLKMRMCGYDE